MKTDNNKYDKAYILLGNENYVPIIDCTIRSIRNFSDLPIFVYLANVEHNFHYDNVKSIQIYNTFVNEDNGPQYFGAQGNNYYINRFNKTINALLIQKPFITKHCLEKYANKICFIDADSVVFGDIDRVFDYYPDDEKYPYLVEGIFDFMIANGRGDPEDGDLTKTIEYPLCKLLNIDQSFRLKTHYRQTGYFVSGQKSIEFLTEWYNTCLNPTISLNSEHYLPFNEETVINCLFWKYKYDKGLPLLYVNGSLETIDIINNTNFNGEQKFISEWLKLPGNKKEILFIHGEKRINLINQMINKISKVNNNHENMDILDKKIKILYLAPHLSTGGMPAFLYKRIEALKKYYDIFDIYVVEFSNYGDNYVIQKNKIKELVGESNFFSLGYLGESIILKDKLIQILYDKKIDIIHIDEMIEGFDSFNRMPEHISNQIYSQNRKWKIVETCHNITFNPDESKIYHPDAYSFCSEYHKKFSFGNEIKNNKIHSDVIQYPIENNKKSKIEKIEAQSKLGFDFFKKHVINVGIWTPGKNQKEFVEIAKLCQDNNIQFHLIGGLAPNFEDYWSPILSELPSNITVWNERDDVETFMTAADVMLFNSTFECNPIVIKEAISFGLKILARNLPQYLDMYSGYIIPIDDNIQDTKSKLLKTINSREMYEIPSYELESFAQKHETLYKKILANNELSIIQHFVDQPFIEIISENKNNEYLVEIFDENNNIHYSNNLKSNHWIKLNRKYFTRWKTRIVSGRSIIYDYTLSFKNKKVYISFDSKSLGDNIAWIPYCLEFKKIHNCELYVSTFWNNLFEDVYPELKFVTPGEVVHDLHGMYSLGYYYDDNREPENPHTIPLQKAATNILGLNYTEIKPKINFVPKNSPITNKYITIATDSTAGLKYWSYPNGWDIVCKYLISLGYSVISVSKEKTKITGVINISDYSIENTMNVIHHSELFIGLSSGLSWLAWALNKHVVMISNFTNEDHEFKSNCTRITNKNVCNSCWNNPMYKFDRNDWFWCPEHKNTERHFECHKSITPEMVINEINKIIKNEN